ncbi:hypothetical protein G6F46_013477 [Rhizopus delemar]|uniref:Uncharacterized protein n=1 Tax=Rhizopus delemar (strain RA 99-880 / ATCC MYA-4621 / FGSC 9543 / NRRL 43880) TaxID=246409 RepID=I1BSC7_RHIO9|nr:hypothetical protein RO3G_03812 [Rhizopus delemar RA 99-880]KAG1485899.1 hypothetical protein G6F54_013313 [Rhizopus delemar]KAG1575057.1 hypothetical protein G6F48_013243 [Rhizopus delemar]KAG1605783.1 hypothetical protein G6F46_013477 [Rhizopus delemar]KAG1611014.1 hypothetical protein G6F45_013171 [Rhizopus arrhizus]|eukprot:EIE79107.1 hypothetical protein RO3G_03812 [Rhizopus delemar RA 99-880]
MAKKPKNGLILSLTVTKHVHFDNEESDESYDTDTDSSTESEESHSEEEDVEKEEEGQSLLVLDDDQGEKVDIILEKETYRIKASFTGLTIQANTSKTITINKPIEERNNHVYLFDVTHPTLLPAQGYFDPCTSLVSNKRNLEIHTVGGKMVPMFLICNFKALYLWNYKW